MSTETRGGGDTFNLVSTASGSSLNYSGHVRLLGESLGYGLFLKGPVPEQDPFVIFYPFTTANKPVDYTPQFKLVAPQSWLGNTGESASQMIFGCDGFFADNLVRAQNAGITDPTWAPILADLENSIASAFNRGIALNDPSTWGERHTWFQQGSAQTNGGQEGKYNYWVEYWHTQGVAVDDLAYAFPYDDKYGSSSNLNDNKVGLAQVVLNDWRTSQAITTTTITHVSPNPQQQAAVKLKAHVGPPANGHPLTGTVTFFIDGVAINANDFSSSPPHQPVPVDVNGDVELRATLPALSDGSTTHTYTLTAVYSGDEYAAPSVAYQPLKLIGPNGDFLMTVTPSQATLGTQVNVSATLLGATFDGTVAVSIAHSDGTGGQLLSTTNVTSANWSAGMTIPPQLLTFTGDVDVSVNAKRINNVSSVVNLVPGQTVSNANFSGAPKIAAFQNPGLTLSLPAAKSGTVRFASNGVEFTATATAGQTALTGLNTLSKLSDNNAPITQVTGNSELLQANTTVIEFVPGWVDVNSDAITTVVGASFISNGAGTVFPLTAVFTPTSGGPYTAYMNFAGPSLS